jgi:hypothetical protein
VGGSGRTTADQMMTVGAKTTAISFQKSRLHGLIINKERLNDGEQKIKKS